MRSPTHISAFIENCASTLGVRRNDGYPVGISGLASWGWHPGPLVVPDKPNTCRLMDFMSAAPRHAHRFRRFNVVDEFNREILAIDVNSGITAEWVVTILERIIAWHGPPDISSSR